MKPPDIAYYRDLKLGIYDPSTIERVRWHLERWTNSRRRPTAPGIPEFIGNIPGRLFKPGLDGWEKTKSGNWLRYRTSSEHVEFYYPKSLAAEPIHFIGLVATKESTGKRTFLFDVRSRQSNKGPHPDMRAAQLLRATLLYLTQQGGPIDAIAGDWFPYSSNFSRFMEGHAAGLTPEAAALNTWTGTQARAHGYDQVRVQFDARTPEPESIGAIFTPGATVSNVRAGSVSR